MSQTTPPPVQRSPLEALLPFRQHVGYGLLVAGAAMAIIPVINGAAYGFSNPALCVWAGAVALTFLVAGVVQLTLPHGRDADDVDQLRMLLLSVLGLTGFVTALFGLVLPFAQYREELAGGLEDWRKHADALTWCLLAFTGGLVLLFVGLTLGRAYERTQAGMRRLMYGYNAVLTSVLLLLILAIVNVLCYSPVYPFSKLRAPVDLTSSRMYTLQPATKNLVAGINQPVKVYMMMPARDQFADQFTTLLQNCRAANERISWESVSPQLNQERYEELAKKYQVTGDSVLVVYGSEPNVQSETIPYADLFKVERDQNFQPVKVQFTGEGALYKTLAYLSEGKSRAKVYFTQGNGELEFDDREPTSKKDAGLGLLVEQVGKGNYEPLPLPFDKKALAEKKEVPDDADVVVVAGPRSPLAPEAIDALRAYLSKPHGPDNKKGKLVVMLDVVKKSDGTMMQTGLEPLLREYGVAVGNNHVLAVRNGWPGTLETIANGRTQIGRAFNNEADFSQFLFSDARTVGAAPRLPGQENAYAVEELIFTSPELTVWAEEDLNAAASPSQLLKEVLTDRKKQREKLKGAPLPLAVTVAESKSDMLPPGHPGVSKDRTPRLVVFGDATWVCNGAMGSDAGPTNADLFRSCLAWLRERQNLGKGPEGTERSTYSLGITEAAATRLKWLPSVLMLIGVVTLGGGVWVVRRR